METKKLLSAAELLEIINNNSEFRLQAQTLAVHRLVFDLPEQVAPLEIYKGQPEKLFNSLNDAFAQKENEFKVFIEKHKDSSWGWEYIFYNAYLNDPTCLSLLKNMEMLDFLNKASNAGNMYYIIRKLALAEKYESAFDRYPQTTEVNLNVIKKFIEDFLWNFDAKSVQTAKIVHSLLLKSFAACLDPAVNTKRLIQILELFEKFKQYLANVERATDVKKEFAKEMEKVTRLDAVKLYRLALSCPNLRIADVMEVYKSLSFYVFPRTAKMVLLRVAAKMPDFLTMQKAFMVELRDAEFSFYSYSKYQIVVYYYHKITILTYLMQKYNLPLLNSVLYALERIMWFKENNFKRWPEWSDQRHKATLKGLRVLLSVTDDADLQNLCSYQLVKLIDVLALCLNGFVQNVPDLVRWLHSRPNSYVARATTLEQRIMALISKLPAVSTHTFDELKEQWHTVGETVPRWEKHFAVRNDLSGNLSKLFYDILCHWLTIIEPDEINSANTLQTLVVYQSSFNLSTEKATKRLAFLKQEAERKKEEKKRQRALEKEELSALLSV